MGRLGGGRQTDLHCYPVRVQVGQISPKWYSPNLQMALAIKLPPISWWVREESNLSLSERFYGPRARTAGFPNPRNMEPRLRVELRPPRYQLGTQTAVLAGQHRHQARQNHPGDSRATP